MAKITLLALIPSRFKELITEERSPPKSVAAPQQESHAHPLKHGGSCPNPDNRRGFSWNVREDSPKCWGQCLFSASPHMRAGRERLCWKHQPLPGHPVCGPYAQWRALTYCSCGFDGSISVEPLFYSLQESGICPHVLTCPQETRASKQGCPSEGTGLSTYDFSTALCL